MKNANPHELRAQAQRCRYVAERYGPDRRRPMTQLAEELENRAADLERRVRS